MTKISSRLGRILATCVIGALAASASADVSIAGDASPAAQQKAPEAAPGPQPGPQKTPQPPKGPETGKTPEAPVAAKPPGQQSGTSAVVMDLSSIQGVIGHAVKSSAGEDMGRIVDLLVTMSGQVRAAVIDFGGVLGVGSRKVAVDWRALDFTELPKNGDIRLLLTRNQVRVSPEYKSGEPVVILEASKPTESPPTAASPASTAGAKPAPSDRMDDTPTSGGPKPPAATKPNEAGPATPQREPATKAH